MAIYHFSAQVISRGKGQSSVAAAAYRSGDRLIDERTGEEKFYRRDVEPDTMILAPSHAPEWVYDRNRLWNEVEKIEKNKNSQLSREINIALPVELSKEQQKELIKNYVQEQFVNRGMVADIAIHRDDPANPHAHVMLTIRPFNENGEWGNKKRKEYELDPSGNKVLDSKGKPKYKTYFLTDWDKKETLEKWREEWANHANKALEREGIQERISHLSNEARGLEQLPTVHLGHVANEMEKRGVQTDKGNVNRDRQEYNALVVELQKYREEKEAIKQEISRQQEQKQKVEDFNTPEERVDLQKASNLLKTESSLDNIAHRREQLDKWENRNDKNYEDLRLKDKTMEEASEHFNSIHSFEEQIKEAKKRIENIDWSKPLKFKENRSIKAQSEQDIARAKDKINHHNEKLKYHQGELGFRDESEFKQIKSQYESERSGLFEKNRKTYKQINYERDVLQKAENAHKNAFVRQVASQYPERPEMHYMKYSEAQKLHELNTKNGRTVFSIEAIEKTLNNRNQKIQSLQDELQGVQSDQERLNRAKFELNEYEKSNKVVEKHEGKWIISKSTKRDYESAVMVRDRAKINMEKNGITGRADFEKQSELLAEKQTVRVPEVKKEIESFSNGIGMLNDIMNGIAQATSQMEREKEQARRKQRQKDAKKHVKGQNLEQEQG
jgi:hypothetical protein